MTEQNMAFGALAEAGRWRFSQRAAEAVLDRLMQLDVESLIGAWRYERNDGGYRNRELDTRLGTFELKIPKLLRGGYFPVSWNRARRPSGL